MILDDISVYLDPEVLWQPKIYDSTFLFRQRYIGNYLRRRIRQAKWRTESFRRLFPEGRLAFFDAPCNIQPEASLIVPIRFDQPRYDLLGPDEHHEFFLGMYLEGIEKANRDFPIPYDVLMQGIEEFRKGGYKNEWVHQRKLLRPFGLHATLLFDMDSKRFRARLRLERKGTVVYEKTILEELPDELCFAFMVKEVVADGNNIVVKGTYDKVTFSLDVSTLE